MFTVIFHDDATEELEQLPVLIRVKMVRLLRKLRENPRMLREPDTKHLGSGLFEIRTMGSDIARGLWVYQTGEKIYMLRFFIKKSQKTPVSEIETALRRLEEINNAVKDS